MSKGADCARSEGEQDVLYSADEGQPHRTDRRWNLSQKNVRKRGRPKSLLQETRVAMSSDLLNKRGGL